MSVATGARSSFEKFILDRQKQLSKQLGKKDYQITPQEYNKAVVEFFGEIPLPSGAKEISRTPTELTYELNGKTYKSVRNTDSNLGADTGRIDTDQQGSLIDPSLGIGEKDAAGRILNTVAGEGQDSFLNRLLDNVTRLQQQPALAALDPESQSALKAIDAATQAKLSQQFGDESQQLIARLFGQGVNRSSIAGEQSNRLLQGQGLVQAQAQSDAAQRELALRQFLSQLGQGNLALSGDQLLGGLQSGGRVVDSILDNLLNREVQGMQLQQSQQQIRNQQNQFDKQYGLERDQFEVQAKAQRQAARRSLVSSIINGVMGVATGGLTGGLSSLFSGARGGMSGGSSTPARVGTASRTVSSGGYY